ncbi:hypothetical protein HMPREF9533_00580 [Escherichia coli MS 60-1]|nr:hypothetical protein HMPREF9533_00580 [Escherichia coli MS 60-1]
MPDGITDKLVGYQLWQSVLQVYRLPEFPIRHLPHHYRILSRYCSRL